MNKKPKQVNIPDELKDVASTKDVSALEDKVNKCYSSERFEDFQDAVEKITLKTIDGTGREKIKVHAKDSAKEYNEEKMSADKNFWAPNLIQIVIGLVAIAGLIVAIFKK